EIVPYWKNFLAHLNHGIALIASYAFAAHVHKKNWRKKSVSTVEKTNIVLHLTSACFCFTSY
ncbi:MAG TPA: hypothetical protein VHK70_11385, partial [Burkholderiaceae bacterium]|nr:hypothetical protein [Burkholderiaceae bacterium]